MNHLKGMHLWAAALGTVFSVAVVGVYLGGLTSMVSVWPQPYAEYLSKRSQSYGWKEYRSPHSQVGFSSKVDFASFSLPR